MRGPSYQLPDYRASLTADPGYTRGSQPVFLIPPCVDLFEVKVRCCLSSLCPNLPMAPNSIKSGVLTGVYDVLSILLLAPRTLSPMNFPLVLPGHPAALMFLEQTSKLVPQGLCICCASSQWRAGKYLPIGSRGKKTPGAVANVRVEMLSSRLMANYRCVRSEYEQSVTAHQCLFLQSHLICPVIV